MKQTGAPEPFRAWRRPWFWPAVVMGITLADSYCQALGMVCFTGGVAAAAILHVYSLCLPEAVYRQLSLDDLPLSTQYVLPVFLLLLTFAVSTRGGKGHPAPGEAEQWELARHMVVSARLIALLWTAFDAAQWWAVSYRWPTILTGLPWVVYLPLALLVWRAVRGPRGRRPPATATSAEQPGPGDTAGNAHG